MWTYDKMVDRQEAEIVRVNRQNKYQDELEWLVSAGEACEHIGCLKHVTHPCEKCGRIAGRGA